MVITTETTLPTEEELTVQEVNVSGVALRAAAFHLGKYCEFANNEFMLCRKEYDDPRKCLQEGKEVTKCSLEFFRQLKKTCYSEFTNYSNCIDKSSSGYEFTPCRNTQKVYDQCVKDNMNLERPPYGYFCEVKVHDTSRPKPPPNAVEVYPDATPALTDEFKTGKAKYGNRFNFLN